MNAKLEATGVLVQNAPRIDGLSFRLFQGDAEFEGMAAVIYACKVADRVERSESADDLRRMYQHLSNSDPYQDVLIADVYGQLVGYSRTSWFQLDGTKERIYQSFGYLHPEWRRRGIGRAMLRWNEAHQRQIAGGHPQDGPRSFESFARDSEAGTHALLQAEGYTPVRFFNQMVRPDLENIPDLPLPAGLEVRPVRPDDYYQVWAASMEAFRDHWGFSSQMEPFEGWMDNRNQQPELWQVAWAGDEVAGMVLNYIDTSENEEYQRKRGWTENICVRRPWRGQGLAKALIARSLRLLKDKGMQDAALGVDSQNLSGALKLYEYMGFRKVDGSTNYRKPFED